MECSGRGQFRHRKSGALGLTTPLSAASLRPAAGEPVVPPRGERRPAGGAPQRLAEPDLEFRAFCARKGLPAFNPVLQQAWDGMACRAIRGERARIRSSAWPSTSSSPTPAAARQHGGQFRGGHSVWGTEARAAVSRARSISRARAACAG